MAARRKREAGAAPTRVVGAAVLTQAAGEAARWTRVVGVVVPTIPVAVRAAQLPAGAGA